MWKIEDQLECIKEHAFERINKDMGIREYQMSLHSTYDITHVQLDNVVIDKTSKVYLNEIKQYFKAHYLVSKMETQVIILGQETHKEQIIFKQYLNPVDGTIACDPILKPKEYKNIELICRKYCNGLDLMFAYYEDRKGGTLYLGHFNDGVI